VRSGRKESIIARAKGGGEEKAVGVGGTIWLVSHTEKKKTTRGEG